MRHSLNLFGSFLLLVGAASVASSQVAPQPHGKYGTWFYSSKHVGPAGEEEDNAPEMEHMSNPLVPSAKISAAGLNLGVSFGRYHSIQVNTDASGRNILNDAANEPSMSVDPHNRNRITVGWRQFDNVTSNFRQAGNAYSTDGGSTWHNNTVFTPGTFRSDPVLDIDANGNFYYNSLQSSFYTDVFKTVTGGSFWYFLNPALGGDKQWMVIDKTNGIGRNNLYQSWSTAGNNYGGRQFTRSTDGGKTWMDPINIPGSLIWGTLDVASNGDLYLAGLGDTSFVFARSTNAKNKAVTPTFDRSTNVDLGGAIVYASNMNPAGLLGQTWIVSDKSSGKYAGNIYMLASVGVDALNPCDVNFSRSTDGGLTWSRYKRINDDLPNKGATHWFGTLSVAPNGRLDACWYDNRGNPSKNNSAMFFTSSFDGGETWKPSVQVTPAFNPNIGYPNQSKMGDYLALISDNAGANIVFSATFNNEEDIWYLRAPANPSTANIPVSATPFYGTRLSGGLADLNATDGSVYTMTSTRVPGMGDAAALQEDYTLSSTPNSLGVRLTASSSVPTTGMFWYYNWTTGRWDFQQAFALTTTGVTNFEQYLGTSPAPYVNGSGKVRILFRALRPLGPVLPPFTVKIDQLTLLSG